jgi:hypothetical protein
VTRSRSTAGVSSDCRASAVAPHAKWLMLRKLCSVQFGLRHRDREGVFSAFLLNHWDGCAVFAGLAVDREFDWRHCWGQVGAEGSA